MVALESFQVSYLLSAYSRVMWQHQILPFGQAAAKQGRGVTPEG